MNRSIQVERAFGVLKQDYGFRRFLTRGKENVEVEMLLLCYSVFTSFRPVVELFFNIIT